MPVLARARLRVDHRQPRPRGLREGTGDVNDMTTAGPQSCAASRRSARFRTHDGVELFYRHWPALRGARARRDRAVPSRPRALRPHGAPGRRTRPARLRLLRLGCARPRPLARRARRFAELSARRCATCRPSSTTSARSTASRSRTSRVVAQSVGAVLVGRLGARLRAAHPLLVLASPAFKVKLYVPFARAGLALHAQAARQLLRQELREGEVPDARSRAHRDLRHRPADRARDLRQHPARPLRRGRPGRRRRAGDHRADAAADLGDRLGRPPRTAARVLRPARARRSRRRHVLHGFFHDTLGERDRARRPSPSMRAFLLRRFAAPFAQRRPDSTPTSAATRATRPTRSPRRCRRCRRAASTGRPRARQPALRRPPVDGREARPRDRLRLRLHARLRLPEPAARRRRRVGRHDRPHVPRIDRLARHPPAQAPRRGTAARRDRATARARARRCTSSTSPPATAATCSRRSPRTQARPDSILLRDYGELNVEPGHALIRDKGLADIARFAQGDAFDRASLAAIAPRPTLGIVSGLYELFPDNALVRASLAGLADAIAPGGFLVYTGQPWHPQLELIARALTSHRGGAGVGDAPADAGRDGRTRRAAGFRKTRRSASTSGASSPSRWRSAWPA